MVIPTVTLIHGKSGRAVNVNTTDAQSYLSNGYRYPTGDELGQAQPVSTPVPTSVSPPAPEAKNEESNEMGGESKPTTDGPVNFDSYNVPTLMQFAEKAGIGNFKKMNRTQLVEALTTAGFVPQA